MTISALELIVLMGEIQVFMMHSARCEYRLHKSLVVGASCSLIPNSQSPNSQSLIPNSQFPIPHSPFPNSPFPIPHSPFPIPQFPILNS
ncbi:MAG: hypothetical protein F6K31_16090 [Symploca sp. SIO2G7]|nr:hypothetical protein [Symploca sp. SIO2G7]